MKLCCGCAHFNRDGNGCRRKIIAIGIDPVWGKPIYTTTKEIGAYRERKSWTGCGKEGRFWIAETRK